MFKKVFIYAGDFHLMKNTMIMIWGVLDGSGVEEIIGLIYKGASLRSVLKWEIWSEVDVFEQFGNLVFIISTRVFAVANLCTPVCWRFYWNRSLLLERMNSVTSNRSWVNCRTNSPEMMSSVNGSRRLLRRFIRQTFTMIFEIGVLSVARPMRRFGYGHLSHSPCWNLWSNSTSLSEQAISMHATLLYHESRHFSSVRIIETMPDSAHNIWSI